MEDLTEENKGPSDDEDDQSDEEEGDQKGEKAENNSCISIYFQSKKHDLKVRNNRYIFIVNRLPLIFSCWNRSLMINSMMNFEIKSNVATMWQLQEGKHVVFLVFSLQLNLQNSIQ